MERIKYVTNKELLAEIDRSKRLFGYFEQPAHARFDAIVHDVRHITPDFVAATLARRRDLMTKQGEAAWGDADPAAVTEADLVFRVMTNEHVPADPTRKRRLKGAADEGLTKLPFPAYKHFVMENGVAREVGRSHWKGNLSSGSFSIDHAGMTNRLAMMFMLLVDRYSKRGNWRGYCVDELTEALTQRGWLNMNEITERDVILSCDAGVLKWSKIKSIYRGFYKGKMFKLDVWGMDALVTPRHKFLTSNGLKEVELLVEKDRIIMTGDAVEGGPGGHHDEFVELAGWMATEGSYYDDPRRHYRRVSIHQNEGKKAERIRSCLRGLGAQFTERTRVQPSGLTGVTFDLTKPMSLALHAVVPGRVLAMSFILSLTQAQRELLIETMIDGDGWRTKAYGASNPGGYRRYSQKDKRQLDAFLALCTMSGHRTATRSRDIVSFGKPTSTHEVNLFSRTHDRHRHSTVENIDFHGGKRSGRSRPGLRKKAHPNEPTFPYEGEVWCPETEYGTFVARRNGTVYVTGNTYVDEMRNHALMQLAQVGLQFDESKSDNPFAFFTQCIKNSFTRILNVERKNQHIRDDLLIIAGVQPSYSRQVEHQLEQRHDPEHALHGASASQPADQPKKRGRKAKASLPGA